MLGMLVNVAARASKNVFYSSLFQAIPRAASDDEADRLSDAKERDEFSSEEATASSQRRRDS